MLSTGLATSIKQVQSSTASGNLKYLPAQKLCVATGVFSFLPAFPTFIV
jgi:hypothetical protein